MIKDIDDCKDIYSLKALTKQVKEMEDKLYYMERDVVEQPN